MLNNNNWFALHHYFQALARDPTSIACHVVGFALATGGPAVAGYVAANYYANPTLSSLSNLLFVLSELAGLGLLGASAIGRTIPRAIALRTRLEEEAINRNQAGHQQENRGPQNTEQNHLAIDAAGTQEIAPPPRDNLSQPTTTDDTVVAVVDPSHTQSATLPTLQPQNLNLAPNPDLQRFTAVSLPGAVDEKELASNDKER